MNIDINHSLIAAELNLPITQVTNTLTLLDEGGTVPFIARYRKERTGSLDEVAIAEIKEKSEKLTELVKRRQSIFDSLTKQDKLTTELQKKLNEAQTQTELEDLYLPFRPKRKTRAELARSKGLAPLAEHILKNGKTSLKLAPYLQSLETELNIDEALAGARDIVAEYIAENSQSRATLRKVFKQKAIISSHVTKNMEESGTKYKDYFDWHEPSFKVAGHRLLAMLRGEHEKILKLEVKPPIESCLVPLKQQYLYNQKDITWRTEFELALQDSYQRLLAPALENELRKELKENADKEAIQVFSENLTQLLLAPPLGQKTVLAIDPGYRTGCKVVCLSKQGDLLDTCTIFPTAGSKDKIDSATNTIIQLVKEHTIEAIGIGNGTAGRETERFIRAIDFAHPVIITLVNEDGASIYSASEVARAEFASYDITVRGSVSIGRRLQDPLAELVKIDPKSIGVGQYQHDVNPSELKKALDRVVEYCVNSVGVELNSASKELLTHIAGVGPTLATNILEYRETNGPFSTLAQLKKVPRLGPKAFEQCAGFLRIRNGKNPLDTSGVHPERYNLVKQIAQDLATSVDQLLHSEELRRRINPHSYIDDEIGLPTLNDILTELSKPGRDPRQQFENFQFSDEIQSIDDLHEGLSLPAIITNITKFGAFADIGIKQDGLIHISQLADRFIKEPGEIVKIGQKVTVKVLEFDKQRKRISLTMKIG